MKSFDEFLVKYFPDGNRVDNNVMYGFTVAQTMEHVLRNCGDDLTRENIMKQAASIRDFAPSTFLPGIRINTSATDFAPIEQLQLMKFKGERWELFGDVISSELGG
jgi:branched-chain amino acid transport system substrate-binding protein